MNRVVFLLEEASMKELLERLLPRMFPTMMFLRIAHEGKTDLEKSIPRKIRAWGEPGVRFVVMRDKDKSDCVEIKRKLVTLCANSGRPDLLVRIVCNELEAWYLGEPDAFGNEQLRGIGRRARFRDPDNVSQPSSALRVLVPEFQKISGARRISKFLSRERNTSTSFQVLLSGLDRVLSEE